MQSENFTMDDLVRDTSIFWIDSFRLDMETIFKRNYTMFESKKLLHQDPDFDNFIQIFQTAVEEGLQGSQFGLANESQLSSFLRKLLQGMIHSRKNQVNLVEAHWETKESIQEFISAPPKKCPRFLAITSTFSRKFDDRGMPVKDLGEENDSSSSDEEDKIAELPELLKGVSPYFFSKPDEKRTFDWIGMAFTLDESYILWIKDFTPGEKPKSHQFKIYHLRWLSFNLIKFRNDIKNHKLKEMSYDNIYNVSIFYIFLDGLCSLICK